MVFIGHLWWKRAWFANTCGSFVLIKCWYVRMKWSLHGVCCIARQSHNFLWRQSVIVLAIWQPAGHKGWLRFTKCSQLPCLFLAHDQCFECFAVWQSFPLVMCCEHSNYSNKWIRLILCVGGVLADQVGCLPKMTSWDWTFDWFLLFWIKPWIDSTLVGWLGLLWSN